MFTLNCKGRLLVIDRPLVMGIINCTPDSFYSGSRQQNIDEVLMQADRMLNDGATILDIGGQSTRPGSEKISSRDEINRVIGPIEAINKRFPEFFISIDTYYSEVAINAVNAGASIVNDISAGSIDPEMIPAVARLKVPYVLMHMQGTPQDMQLHPQYSNVTKEVFDFLLKKIDALKKSGITDIIADPGFGFGKTIADNFRLLQQLEVFTILPCPLLLGISRKSTIYKTLGVSAEEALNGTTVLNTVGLMKGANILRVHDVKQAAEAIHLVTAINSAVNGKEPR